MLRMAMFAVLAAVAGAASVGKAQAAATSLRHIGGAGGFVRSLEFKHRLRVCNAYPYAASLDVYRGDHEKLTGSEPMPYKSCKD